MKKKTLLILVGDLGSFQLNRLKIALAAKKKGYIVHIIYGEKGKGCFSSLRKHKLNFKKVKMRRGFSNPLNEIITLLNLFKIFKKLRPDIIHLVAIKPYLYGGIIARIIGIKAVVSAVAGLGSIFIRQDFKGKFYQCLLYPLFKIAFNHCNQRIIVQNNEDKKWLIKWGVLKSSKVCLIKGSGVDLKKFKYTKENIYQQPIVTFPARLIYHKGIIEFISAARILNEKNVKADFWVVGDVDNENPSSLKKKDLESFQEYKFINFKGYQRNIKSIYTKSNIICLPSYREGMPLSLLEAAATGRAIVTTNVPGCRDAIVPDKTGLIVPLKSIKQLARAMNFLIKNCNIRLQMGKDGRKLAEKQFDAKIIIDEHLKIYNQLLI